MDKIVLIEDDPGIRTVIRLALKGAGELARAPMESCFFVVHVVFITKGAR